MFDLTLTDIDFEVTTKPLYDEHGRAIPGDLARAVVRMDTGDTIATCGKNFMPVQNRDIVNPVLDELDAQNYDIYFRRPDQKNLYDLAGKKGAFVWFKTADNGAVMVAEIVTGDFIRPTGRSSYLDRGPDTMLVRHRLLNAHNGKYAASAISDYERVICMNGIVRPTFWARTYGKHTLNFDVEGLKAKIASAARMMEQDAEMFGLYARTKLSPLQAAEFIKATLAKMTPDALGAPRYSEALTRQILDLFRNEDQTVWGLMQAMTYWSTHGEMRRSTNEVTGRLGRDQRVASALASKRFQALIDA